MLGEEGPLAGIAQSPPQLGTKRGVLGPLRAKEGVEGRGVLGLEKGFDASSSWHPRPAPTPAAGLAGGVHSAQSVPQSTNRQSCQEGLAGRQRGGAVIGGAPCEELAVAQIVVDPGTRWGRGWCVVVLSDKGPPRRRCSASLSPGRPTAQGTPGDPEVSAALHTPGPRGWWGRGWHRPDRGQTPLHSTLWRNICSGEGGGLRARGGRRPEPLPLTSAA